MNDHYILDENNKPVLVDLMTWAEWYEKAEKKIVKHDKIGDLFVSTVFLGLDYRFGIEGEPVLFETMVFDHGKMKKYKVGGSDHESPTDIYQERYCHYDEALAAHEVLVERIKKGEDITNYK